MAEYLSDITEIFAVAFPLKSTVVRRKWPVPAIVWLSVDIVEFCKAEVGGPPPKVVPKCASSGFRDCPLPPPMQKVDLMGKVAAIGHVGLGV